MKIRDGLDSDISAIIKLFEILDSKHSRNQDDFKCTIDNERYIQIIDKCLKNENYFLSVAEAFGKLIGFGIARLKKIENHHFLKDSKIGEILYLLIDDDYKLKGHGKNLLSNLETKLIASGAEKLKMRVYEFNKEACPEKVNYKKKFTIYEKIVN